MADFLYKHSHEERQHMLKILRYINDRGGKAKIVAIVRQNFLAGILLLLNEPLRGGDQIVRGDHEGTVESIETRYTPTREPTR